MTYLAAFVEAFVSAWVPFVPVEAYLLAVLTHSAASSIWVAAAAAAGQTIGKVLMFLSSRGVVRSERIRRWHEKRARPGATRWSRCVTRHLEGRQGPLLILTSAVVGLPPLLPTTVVAGTSGMRVRIFAAACLAGRWLRFYLLLAAPAALLGLPG